MGLENVSFGWDQAVFQVFDSCEISILPLILSIIPYSSQNSLSPCLVLMTMYRMIMGTDGETDPEFSIQVLAKKRK